MMQKQIIFLEGTPTVTCFKIAKILRRRGYDTVLISLSNNFDKVFYEGYSKVISFNLEHLNILKHPLSTFKNLFKNLRIFKIINHIRKLKPYVIVGVAAPYPITLSAITLYLFKKIPFIYFPYDVNLLKYNNIENNYILDSIPKIELKSEIYCLKNADGIIFKGDEYKYIKNMLDIKSPVLQFLPYCLKESIVPINKNKLSKLDGKIHIVYVGRFSKDLYGGMEKILFQKLHLHVYTGQYDLILNSKEHAKFLNNKYFHLHKPVNQYEICKEISKYDFGFWLSVLDLNIWKKEWIASASGNKLSTYIEAGVPLIYYKDMAFNHSLIQKYGLGIGVDNNQANNLKILLKKFNKKQFLKDIKFARKDYEMSNNIHKLEEFFDEVIKAKNN